MVVPSLSLDEHTAGEMKKRVDIVHQRGIQFGRGAYSMNLQEQRERKFISASRRKQALFC
jgi:hypothetical protein